MTEEINFKIICDIAARVAGLPKGSLSFKNRSKNIQSARASACYIALTEEDISRNVIAKIIDRDRTATYHYQASHKKKFNDKKCDFYRNTFTKIYQEYKNLDSNKYIFKNGKKLYNFLLNNKVVESKKSDVVLEVKSGEAICFIKTCYFNYLNQLENINIALENYHYTIKII